MLRRSNDDASYQPKTPTRISRVISYVNFSQGNEYNADGYNKYDYPVTKSVSIQPPTGRKIIHTTVRDSSAIAVTSFSVLTDTAKDFSTERVQPKSSVLRIEEEDDYDVKQSSTQSTPPTGISRSLSVSDPINQKSPTDMSLVHDDYDNRHSAADLLNDDDTGQKQRSNFRRKRSASEHKIRNASNAKRVNSEENLSQLGLHEEDELQDLVQSVTPLRNPIKARSKTKYYPAVTSSTSATIKNGKLSSLKYSSSLITPRGLVAIPSITHRTVHGVLIRLFRNSDAFHHGVKIAINELELKSWEAFLNYLNSQPKLRLSTGGIKHIYTLDGHEVRSINQFYNRQSYVVASGAFIPTYYHYCNDSFTDEVDLHLNLQMQLDKTSHGSTQLSTYPNQYSPTLSGDRIFLLPYSKLNMYEILLLNRNITQTFSEWLQDQVTDLLSQYTNDEQVAHLFAVTKHNFVEVKSFSELFNMIKSTDSFIGCTEDEYVHAKHYLETMKPNDLFVERLWPRRLAERNSNIPQKQPAVDGAKLLINWIHGYDGGNEVTKKLHPLPENELLYVIGSVCILYEPKLRQQRFYTSHINPITCVTVHQNQSLVASSESGSSKSNRRAVIHIWDHIKLRTTAEMRKEQFGSFISLVYFSPKAEDNLLLVISREKPQVILFVDWKRNEIMYSVSCKSDSILTLLFLFNTTEWLACISHQQLLFYRIDSSTKPWRVLDRRESEVQNIYTGAAAYSLVGERFLVGDNVGNVHVWGLVDKEPKLIVVQENFLEYDVQAISSISQDVFLVADGRNQIKIWNMKLNSVEIIRLNETVGSIQSVCCIRQGSQCNALAIGTKSNYIISKDITKDQFDVIMRGHTSPSIDTCYFKLSRYFFSISCDRYLFKWNNQTRAVEWAAKCQQPISCADLHPERNIIVLGTETSKLLIYDTLSSYYVATVTLRVNTSIKSVRFSPDGSNLAVGLQNGNVCVFEVLGNGDFHPRTGGTLLNDNSPISNVVWSVDSKYLLTIYMDNNHHIWSVPSFELARGKTIQNIKWNQIVHPIMHNISDKAAIDLHTSIIILNANMVVSCGKDGQLRLFRNRYERNSHTFHFGLGPVQSISPSTSNNTFLLSMREHPVIAEVQIKISSRGS